jgi:cytochrome P450
MAYQSVLAVILLAVFLFYRYVLYPAFFSPLSKIPAIRTSARVLPTWFWWTERRGGQAKALFDAHQRYGHVIRVKPNMVHIASLDGLRVAFNSGRFERSDWALQFLNFNGTPNLLTMLDSKRHATRRRIVSQIFSKSYILGSVDFQRLSEDLLFKRLIPVFDEAAEANQGVDVYEMALAASAEFMSAYQVGTAHCMDLMRKGREHERKVYLENGRTKVLELKEKKKAAKYLEDQTLDICRKVDAFLESRTSGNKNSDDTENSTFPVVFAQMRNSVPEKEGAKTLDETLLLIASEFLDNLEASRVAMGITLNYVLHELSIRPSVQAQLRNELTPLQSLVYPPGQNRISTATLRQLDGNRLLDAVIMETLRVRNPVLIPFERVVPKEGAAIDGYFLPGGTIVAVSAYSLHMNSAVYPDAKEWIPQRWLDTNDDAEKGKSEDDPRRWFWGFGSGGRMCVGNNFAMMGESIWIHAKDNKIGKADLFTVMKLIVATIYTNYTTYVIDDEGIEQVDQFIAAPAREKLILGFKRVQA